MILNDRLEGMPRNCLGPVFPTRDAEAMTRLLGIAPGDRVLDVGGGFSPFDRADVITDLSFSDSSNRNGAEMMFRPDKSYVECPAEALPFEDRSFDFAFCAHVLEHVSDPARALREMARVAPRGFLEVPNEVSDYLAGNPTHRWLIRLEDGVLVFRRRDFLDPPLRNFLHARVYGDPEFHDLVHGQYRNLLNIQLAWEGEIPFRVEEATGDAFDYDDPTQAGESHLRFAYNLHRFGAAPEYAVADAYEATRLLPQSADAWIVRGLYDARMLLLREAADDFGRAIDLRPGDPVARHDLELVERAIREGRFEPRELATPRLGSLPAGPRAPEAPRPRVSVVLDAPSDPARLFERMRCVVTQRYPCRDLVIVAGDAGGARAVLDRLRPSSEVTIVPVEAGLPLAERLNRGHAKARGELVAYLAGDAVWTVFHLEHLVERLTASSAAGAYSDALRLGYVEEEGTRRLQWERDSILSADLAPGDLGSSVPVPVAAVLHRREVFPGFDPSLEELLGRDFLLRIARTAEVVHLRRVTLEHRAPREALDPAEEQQRILVEQRKVLENYSHFEPIELMRRLVELYNENEALRSRLAQAAGTDP